MTYVLALECILVVVESVVKEIKDMLRFRRIPLDKHLLPKMPTFSGEAQPEMLMSYITELINVFMCDFDLLRIPVNNEEPKSTHESVVLFRRYLLLDRGH